MIEDLETKNYTGERKIAVLNEKIKELEKEILSGK